jgi:hypothetical protein
MRMNRQVALMASAGFGVAFLAACSDSPMEPTAAPAFVPKTSFAVGAVTTTPAPEAVTGKIVVCKTGNAGGSFTFTRSTEGSTLVASSYVGGGNASISGVNIAVNTCLEVANDDSPSGNGSHITITEAPAANTVQTITACRFRGYALDGVTLNAPENCVYVNGGDLFLNHFHGFVITYNNVFTPPPPPPSGCTYTKGWYRNNGSNTVTAVDGRSKSDAQKIFDATPGKPGGVTWEGTNDVLNLYQQLLAALLNGGAGSGITAVTDAITAAENGTGGSGLAITTNLSQAQVSALINTLSSFNEGSFKGFPHCG